VPTSKERLAFQGHTNWAYAVAFSPDGKMLASGTYDRTLRLWDPATGQERNLSKKIEHIESSSHLARDSRAAAATKVVKTQLGKREAVAPRKVLATLDQEWRVAAATAARTVRSRRGFSTSLFAGILSFMPTAE
jgi:WD40 repeat protein